MEPIFAIFEYSVFEKYILNPYSFAGDPARAAAIWGRVASRDATASARATRNPAYAGPGFGAAPSACLAPPDGLGALYVVMMTIWVKPNRLTGAETSF